MDKAMSIINAERQKYVEWLMLERNFSKADAERMADIMGY